MKPVAIFDFLALLISVLSIVVLLTINKKKLNTDIKLLLISFLFLSSVYYTSLFVEWYGISTHLDFYEDLIGALIPMLIGFVIYSFIQRLNSQELAESQQRLDLALKGTRAGTWEYHFKDNKLNVDEQWAEIMGFSKNEIKKFTIDIFRERIHPDDVKQINDEISQFDATKKKYFNYETRMQHKNGHWIWISIQGMISEWKSEKEPEKAIGTIIEITFRKKSEEELKKQIEKNKEINIKYLEQNKELIQSIEKIKLINNELVIAKNKAEESDQLKSAFLGNISHEIRTPMNGILGFTELLKNPDLNSDKQQNFINIIHKSGKRMLSIINDLIDISRIETGQVEIEITSVDINEILQELYNFFLPEAEAKELELNFRLLKKSPENFFTDPTKLNQILSNLISNAIKYTKKGKIDVWYTMNNNSFINIYVKDSGIGIPLEERDKIFERFQQVNYASISDHEGCGLGLTITKAYIEKLKGEITLNSNPGIGSEFKVSLPSSYNSEIKLNSPVDEEVSYNDEQINKTQGPFTVLIAEDDDVSYMYLEELLLQTKSQVLRAETGKQAVEICRKHPEIVLVFMDIKMPEMNGYDAIQLIKEFRPTLPIVAQTAYAMEGDKEKVLQAGSDEYLSKPIRKKDIDRVFLKYRK